MSIESYYIYQPNNEEDCIVCREPLTSSLSVAHTGTGVRHPSHLSCTERVIQQVQSNCPVCFVPINTNLPFSWKEKGIKNLTKMWHCVEVTSFAVSFTLLSKHVVGAENMCWVALATSLLAQAATPVAGKYKSAFIATFFSGLVGSAILGAGAMELLQNTRMYPMTYECPAESLINEAFSIVCQIPSHVIYEQAGLLTCKAMEYPFSLPKIIHNFALPTIAISAGFGILPVSWKRNLDFLYSTWRLL